MAILGTIKDDIFEMMLRRTCMGNFLLFCEEIFEVRLEWMSLDEF